MKSYDNKKFYNYKKSHKRKKRTRHTLRWWKLGGEYTKEKRRQYRTRCKAILREKIHDDDLKFPLYKKTMWWDS